MEFGMGIHGEPGIVRTKLTTANEMVDEMMERIFADYHYAAGDEVSILVNSLGATPLEELYIAYKKISEICTAKSIMIYRPYIGRFATSFEMAGMSITILKLDFELKQMLDFKVDTPFFKQP